MFSIRSNLFALVVAAVATVAFVSAAEAGWVTIKNDTNKAVVVQEVTVMNGKQVRGKPTKLLAGESFREFQNTAGTKTYEVVDAANTATALWSGPLNCKADTQSFSVTSTKGVVSVAPVPEPPKKP